VVPLVEEQVDRRLNRLEPRFDLGALQRYGSERVAEKGTAALDALFDRVGGCEKRGRDLVEAETAQDAQDEGDAG
jgi:hypothetical protein